ncbi:MAG: twin-arginine translocase TatA/TatE family subunit [Acidobacteriales bacterium]|nr:twin-arginine translocase TatA/TatE family subunit [Terriglobales bacterium]
MPSFQDSALIFFLALLLFGPKKLPELARQLGKLMAEFRRASNEFRMQMEDELRMSEQAEQQKKIAEMEAAAPIVPAITDGSENITEHTIADPNAEPLEEHPHMHPFGDEDQNDWTGHGDGGYTESLAEPAAESATASFAEPAAESATEPLPIATSGDLQLMPPSTGLPVASSSISQAFASIPRAPEPQKTADQTAAPAPDNVAEASLHG